MFNSSGGEKKEDNVAAARPRVNLEGPAPRDNLPAGARRRRPGEAGLLFSKTNCTRHHRLLGSNPVVEAEQLSRYRLLEAVGARLYLITRTASPTGREPYILSHSGLGFGIGAFGFRAEVELLGQYSQSRDILLLIFCDHQ